MRPFSLACWILPAVLSLPLAACGGGGSGGGDPVVPPIGGVEDPEQLLEIVETGPEDGAEDANVDLIYAAFATDLDPATVASNQIIVETPVGALRGTVEYHVPTRRILFTPDYEIAGGLEYTVRLIPGILDAEGRGLAETFTFSFTMRERAFDPERAVELESDAVKLVASAENGRTRAAYLYEVDRGATSQYHLGAIDNYDTWQAGEFISTNANPRVDPEYGMAVSANRDTVVAWTREASGQRDLWFRYQALGNSLFPPTSLEIAGDRETSTPVVTIADNGVAVIAWLEGASTSSLRDVRAAMVLRSGSIIGPVTLDNSAGIASDLHVSVGANGLGMLVWAQKTSAFFNVYAVNIDQDVGFGIRRQIDEYVGGDAFPARMVARFDGSVAGIMKQVDPAVGPDEARLVEMVFTPGEGWHNGIVLDPSFRRHTVARPYVTATGDAVFAWSSGDADVQNTIKTRTHRAALAWNGLRIFPADQTRDVASLKVVGQPTGHLGLAWSGLNLASGYYGVYATVRSTTRDWLQPHLMGIGNSTNNWVRFGFGVEPSGNARVVYDRFISGSSPTNRVLDRTLRIDGTVGAVTGLDQVNDLVARDFTLFMSDRGVGALLWGRYEGAFPGDLLGASIR